MKIVLKPILVSLLIMLCSCGVYTFSGASISNEIKTANVHYFQNQASLAPSNVPLLLTESLKDKLIAETNLLLTTNEADLDFSGYISNYSIKPVAIQANETAAKNRLTISVKVTFVNYRQTEFDYEKTFSSYADYDSKQDFSSLENELTTEIINELTESIFNEALASW